MERKGSPDGPLSTVCRPHPGGLRESPVVRPPINLVGLVLSVEEVIKVPVTGVFPSKVLALLVDSDFIETDTGHLQRGPNTSTERNISRKTSVFVWVTTRKVSLEGS